VIDKTVTSDESKLMMEAAASLDGPVVPPVPERNDASEYTAYWQVRSWFFPVARGNNGNSYRAGDE
jgi:hypothetical protein